MYKSQKMTLTNPVFCQEENGTIITTRSEDSGRGELSLKSGFPYRWPIPVGFLEPKQI